MPFRHTDYRVTESPNEIHVMFDNDKGITTFLVQPNDCIANGSGFFQHGHTYLGHPIATAAGCAVVKELLERDLISGVREKGIAFEARLRARFAQSPHVGDIRGRGLFWGMEFVADRSNKAPFAPHLGVAGKLKKAAMGEGLVCYPMPGTRNGKDGDHVLLAPPFIMTEPQMDEVVEKLARAVEAVLNSVSD